MFFFADDGTAHGQYALKGQNPIFTPKGITALGKDVSGFATFWNTQHIAILQFHSKRSTQRRCDEVNKRYRFQTAASTAVRDFRKNRGLKQHVRACSYY